MKKIIGWAAIVTFVIVLLSRLSVDLGWIGAAYFLVSLTGVALALIKAIEWIGD